MELMHAVNGRMGGWSADSCLDPMIILFDCGMLPAVHQKLFLCADNHRHRKTNRTSHCGRLQVLSQKVARR